MVKKLVSEVTHVLNYMFCTCCKAIHGHAAEIQNGFIDRMVQYIGIGLSLVTEDGKL
jgi:hypothetical protein